MPIFAQKNKSYIKSHIAKSIEPSLLGKQIAEELMKRDYSIFGVNDYTIHSNSNVPEMEIIDSLSEEDGHNFTLEEWINLYKKAQEIASHRLEKQILKERNQTSAMSLEDLARKIEKFILQHAASGDLVITMGAGDVVKIGEDLISK